MAQHNWPVQKQPYWLKMKAIYTPEHMLNMLGAAQKIQHQQIQNGTHWGMQALAAPIEMENAHCLNCKDKRDFVVEGTDEHKNGALRKYGTCPECGSGLSKYTPGKNRKWGKDKKE
jgi:hypothetical protein